MNKYEARDLDYYLRFYTIPRAVVWIVTAIFAVILIFTEGNISKGPFMALLLMSPWIIAVHLFTHFRKKSLRRAFDRGVRSGLYKVYTDPMIRRVMVPDDGEKEFAYNRPRYRLGCGNYRCKFVKDNKNCWITELVPE